jgi:predicted DNA-binding transcriptional regulator AlpA
MFNDRMGPTVTAKSNLPPVPHALADVALIDGPTCAAAGGISLSTWHELVRAKQAPQPVMRSVRCTRWRQADVRAWLIDRAAKAEADTASGARLVAKAKKASDAAKAKRAASAAA